MTTFEPAVIWGIFAAAGAGTFLLRLSFLGALGREASVRPGVARALGLVPAAVLAALVAPAVAGRGTEVDLLTAQFTAAVLAAIVAWRTRNVPATLVTGMVALWVLQALG